MLSATGVADTSSSSSTSAPSCRRFTLAEIQSATNDFDDELVIGRGGFGKVYESRISIEETGHVVAIKRLDCMSNQGASEFRAEIEMLSKLRHCNLVSLIGYCDDNKEMILVYEYMPNGTLYDHLHKDAIPLTWVERLKIAIDAGSGLDYLHTSFGTRQGVIHRDIKSSNILLNENWEAMLSDFGLSKIGPVNQSFVDASVKGTFGYLDPEYFYTRKLTVFTDVYAFGVVLFELLSGRLAVDERQEEEQCSLVRWSQKCVKQRKYDQMVDPTIRGTVSNKFLKRFAQIAYRCLLSVPKERPAMTEVVGSLQALLEQQQNSDVPDSSLNVMGFTWKINKYLVSATKQNTGDTSSMKCEPATKRHLCLGLVKRVPLFENMDERLLDAICERLKPCLYTNNTYIVREGDPVDEMLFIIRGHLEIATTDGGRSGFFNSGFLKEGDFCGEELLTWALDPKSGVNLPSSTRTVKALTEVKAFALPADELKFVVAGQFRRLHSRQVQHTFRNYSQQWRTWATCFIQVAWRRYSKRKIQRKINEEEAELAARKIGGSGTSYSLGATFLASKFAANDELKFVVAGQFRRLHSRQVQHTFRNYSQQWRTWATCFIQVAWRRYSKRKIQRKINEEEAELAARKIGGSGTSYSLGATFLASKFAANALRGVHRNRELKSARELMKLQKPPEPDFTADAD